MGYDRNEVLERTDLGALADQLVGPHKGRGAGATWPCPEPGHGEQTGKTPPVSIFRTGYGDERWRCHSCGAGGTAIDLVMTTHGVRFPEAIELLARRAGVAAVDKPMPALRTARIQRPEPVPEGSSNPAVERFVAAAENYLWSEQGQPMQRWLAERGLGEEVLRANRIGADPGPAGLDRARGLPRGGPAVVLPVLGADGTATYLQNRYLIPKGHKYDNPSTALAGQLPRTAEVRLPRPAADPGLVVVSEGIPDALVAAQAGYRAAAVLGAGVPDERTAAALVERYPNERLVLAFDADGPGQAGAERLHELLSQRGAGDRVARLEVPVAAGDLNAWQLSVGPAFGDQLGHAIARSTHETEAPMVTDPLRQGAVVPPPGPSTQEDLAPRPDHIDQVDTHPSRTPGATPSDAEPEYRSARAGNWRSSLPVDAPRWGRSGDPMAGDDSTVVLLGSAAGREWAERATPDLVDRLETIRYHHVLVDDPALAAASLTRIEQAMAAWNTADAAQLGDRGTDALAHPLGGLPSARGIAVLDGQLEQLAYQHVLGDGPYLAQLNLDTATSTVRGWSSNSDRTLETDLDQAGVDPGLVAAQRWAFDHGLVPTPDLNPTGPNLEPPGSAGLAIDF